MQEKLIERLTRYVKIDTQSDDSSDSVPSTKKQFDLLDELKSELVELGLEEVTLDDKGYLFATLPANTNNEVVVGFMAHVDTSPDFSGENVSPKVVQYVGGDIVLNEELNIVLSPEEFPTLDNQVGHRLMVTDGTTLLGADNKAGIAEIVTAVEYLLEHPEIERPKVRIAFTPDEEIGRGPHDFDVEAFGADHAYTVDGGGVGELQYESFNAAGVRVTFHGKSVHPGTAKDTMINAGRIAAEFVSMFDENETPERTEGYEGFYHVGSISGNVEHVDVTMIVRDHDKENFENRKRTVEENVETLQKKYGEDVVELVMKDQYYNMKDKIEPVMEIVETARVAMESLDIDVHIEPVRGGTDGSQLSYKGLPTPNLFTGGYNFHGKFEYASIDEMELATQTIVEIIKKTV
ncbi:peptidase T [Aliicoccus persicus]|uniref:Peptidase T n=1 Tax=Aliicoccus persicus TaxID=930138 RepID=A0A662Z6M0_9STAP|nr:peptidase T [Aliicoccus persicus]SEW11136.1 peptidase T. Metallo peptidase. MEROPS family M20B [Aliicoccus persicus]